MPTNKRTAIDEFVKFVDEPFGKICTVYIVFHHADRTARLAVLEELRGMYPTARISMVGDEAAVFHGGAI